MEPAGVTVHDLELLRRIIDPDRPCAPEDSLPQSLLEDVADLVGCDDVTLQVMDHRTRYIHLQSTTEEGEDEDPEMLALFWRDFWDSSCSYPQRTGSKDVTRMSDFRRPASRDPRVEYDRAVGITHEMLIPLPVVGSEDHRLLLFRSEGPDFTERDVLLLTLLRPHITEVHSRQLQRQRGVRELTERQWEVVRLVAAGSTNRGIARALGLTEHTVAKHLENIYVRLGAASRTEAVATARALGRTG
jgi:DNA-binding CsgD family transcriptional regulator